MIVVRIGKLMITK